MVLTKVRQLSPELQKIAIEELNEVPERTVSDIQALKTWISQQPHLRARTDDQFLLSFLRGCKFSLERAKSKIDKFHSLRTKFPDLFSAANKMDRILEILRYGPVACLPTPLNDNGPRICSFRARVCPAEKYHIAEMIMVCQLMGEIILMEDDHAVVNGVSYLLDFSNISATHIFQLTPSLMRKLTVWLEEAVPLRLKGTHFINAPMGFETIFNMIKQMMSKKQQDRLHIHSKKMEHLYAHIPKRYLPQDYGGENGSLEELTKEWTQRFIDYRDYFKESESYGTDESLRPGKPIDYESIFGLEGSFRKLNVD